MPTFIEIQQLSSYPANKTGILEERTGQTTSKLNASAAVACGFTAFKYANSNFIIHEVVHILK